MSADLKCSGGNPIGIRKPSWSNAGQTESDQWHFELRFDEVIADSMLGTCKINKNIQYFHQVKSGVENQYSNDRMIASYGFPNHQNFLLYGIRKF